MKQLLLFGGTTEGRILAKAAMDMGYQVTLCVATDYGQEVLPFQNSGITVHAGRLDEEQMQQMMTDVSFSCVVDATHPYAVAVSRNIRSAAKLAGVSYLRLLRPESVCTDCRYADNISEACAMAGQGNLLAATGSKEIFAYTTLADYQNRVYARVLPTPQSVELCHRAGLSDSHILTALGPFSVEQNEAVLREHSIKTMVTKDGGAVGGFAEKLTAAQNCGVEVIVVRRPQEIDGFSSQQILQKLKEAL